MKTNSSLIAFALLLATLSPAAELEPTLGKKGKLFLEEKFEGNSALKGWNTTVGKMTVTEGALRLSEVAADKHAGAFRKPLPVQDVAIQLDFRFEGATMLHVGFDPAAGELKKKGHLYSLVITPELWQILEHNDKSNPASKNVALARAATKFERGQWYTLLLENKGLDVIAHVTGREPLRATAKDFHVKKPGLVFRVGGKDGSPVLLDNVKVWELK